MDQEMSLDSTLTALSQQCTEFPRVTLTRAARKARTNAATVTTASGSSVSQPLLSRPVHRRPVASSSRVDPSRHQSSLRGNQAHSLPAHSIQPPLYPPFVVPFASASATSPEALRSVGPIFSTSSAHRDVSLRSTTFGMPSLGGEGLPSGFTDSLPDSQQPYMSALFGQGPQDADKLSVLLPTLPDWIQSLFNNKSLLTMGLIAANIEACVLHPDCRPFHKYNRSETPEEMHQDAMTGIKLIEKWLEMFPDDFERLGLPKQQVETLLNTGMAQLLHHS
ncbi:hypothetical protein M231_05093 [Tremella mesenterica]|uniref:Uncharacterized protein n=1 Tax=Tremella mesenterica TaxID=5217 RepID=A0A4V1M3P8_TREME|nr:hypothetical protein M231_05093 [Tremella mesenterica]